jgi:hypothetical protein
MIRVAIKLIQADGFILNAPAAPSVNACMPPCHVYSGWTEAADLDIKGICGAIAAKTVTYEFERLMEGATLRKCSKFTRDINNHMD